MEQYGPWAQVLSSEIVFQLTAVVEFTVYPTCPAPKCSFKGMQLIDGAAAVREYQCGKCKHIYTLKSTTIIYCTCVTKPRFTIMSEFLQCFIDAGMGVCLKFEGEEMTKPGVKIIKKMFRQSIESLNIYQTFHWTDGLDDVDADKTRIQNAFMKALSRAMPLSFRGTNSYQGDIVNVSCRV